MEQDASWLLLIDQQVGFSRADTNVFQTGDGEITSRHAGTREEHPALILKHLHVQPVPSMYKMEANVWQKPYGIGGAGNFFLPWIPADITPGSV